MRISDWSSDVCSSDLLDHDEDGVVIENGHREQKQEGKLEKDLPQTDKSGDSLKGDTPEEDMPATEEEWSLWSQDIEAALIKADRADLVNEIAQREDKRPNAASKERSDYIRGLTTEKQHGRAWHRAHVYLSV